MGVSRDLDQTPLPGKRPGLQGPIDDAFTTSFLCVSWNGQSLEPTVQAWADANLKRFAYEWRRYFRGELPMKNDTDVTDDDLRKSQSHSVRRPRQQSLDRPGAAETADALDS